MSKLLPIARLGDLLNKSEELVDILPEKRYKQVTVQLWGKGVALRNEVSGSEIAAKRRTLIHSQQFILSRIDARNGAFGIVPDSLEEGVVSNDFPVFNLNSSKIIPGYLGWMCKTKEFIDICKAASEGTTNRVRLKVDEFLESEIPLPEINEQRSIVARIEELAARINEARELRRRASEEIDALLRSYLKKCFLSFEKKTGNNITIQIGQIIKAFGGGTPSKHNPAYWSGEIPWVSPKDMTSIEIVDSEDHITKEAVSESSTSLVPSNSVLIVVRSGILRRTIPVAINRVPVTINQDLKALMPCPEVLPEYIRWWIKANEGQVLQCVKGGTTVQSLIWEKFIEMEILVPSIDDQHEIIVHLDSLQAELDALRRHQSETAAALQALLPAVLERAFRGEL